MLQKTTGLCVAFGGGLMSTFAGSVLPHAYHALAFYAGLALVAGGLLMALWPYVHELIGKVLGKRQKISLNDAVTTLYGRLRSYDKNGRALRIAERFSESESNQDRREDILRATIAGFLVESGPLYGKRRNSAELESIDYERIRTEGSLNVRDNQFLLYNSNNVEYADLCVDAKTINTAFKSFKEWERE